MKQTKIHESVMVGEVLDSLHVKKLGKYIDATLGTGGHTLEIIKAGGEVLGIEADPEMLALAESRIRSEVHDSDKYKLVNDNFVNIDQIAKKNNFNDIDGIILDLGVSNLHLLDEERGFSFSNSNPDTVLDMRLNPKMQGVKASDLLNVLREDQLQNLFEVALDRSSSRWISSQIVKTREQRPFKTIADFMEICANLKNEKSHLHPATLPFLALRIAVNSELSNLEEVLPKAYKLLKPGGKLLVITFHSKEDGLVKSFDKNSKLVLPSANEIENNNRARSAKLRIIVKK